MTPPVSLALDGSHDTAIAHVAAIADSARRRSTMRAARCPSSSLVALSSSARAFARVADRATRRGRIARSRCVDDALFLHPVARCVARVWTDMSNGRARSCVVRAATRIRAPARAAADALARRRRSPARGVVDKETSPRRAHGSRRRHDGDARGHFARKFVGTECRRCVDVHARWTRSRRRVERARERERGRFRRVPSSAMDVVRAHGTSTLGVPRRRGVSARETVR